VTGGHDKFTFDFDAEGATMWLDYDGTSIHIYGTAFGGRDAGTEYDPDWTSMVEIDFTYSVADRTADPQGLEVTTADFSNSGTMVETSPPRAVDGSTVT